MFTYTFRCRICGHHSEHATKEERNEARRNHIKKIRFFNHTFMMCPLIPIGGNVWVRPKLYALKQQEGEI